MMVIISILPRFIPAFELLMFEYYDEIYGSDAKLMEIRLLMIC